MGHNCECVKMGLAHEKKSYLQEKANLFEIGSIYQKCLFTRICGRNPVQGVRQAGDISTLLQF